MSSKNRKFYTAFLFESAPDLHCTHHFLGECSPKTRLPAIQAGLDEYFKTPRSLPPVTFDRVQMFGPDNNIRVLVPKYFHPIDFLPDLLEYLRRFKASDFGDYKPHVTTDTLDSFSAPITHYALMQKGTIIQKWKLG